MKTLIAKFPDGYAGWANTKGKTSEVGGEEDDSLGMIEPARSPQ